MDTIQYIFERSTWLLRPAYTRAWQRTRFNSFFAVVTLKTGLYTIKYRYYNEDIFGEQRPYLYAVIR